MTALLAIAAVLFAPTLVAPWALRPRPWALRHPRLAVAAWLGTWLSGVFVVLALLAGASAQVVRDSTGPVALSVAIHLLAWCTTILVGCLLAVVATRYYAMTDLAAQQRWDTSVLRASATAMTEPYGVTLVQSPQPVAMSYGHHRDGAILISQDLAAALSGEHLAAVVAHERAHQRGHHRLLLQLAALNLACFPRFAAARRFSDAIHLLTELLADDAAARTHGRTTVADALDATGKHLPDGGLDLRANRLRASTRR